MKKYLTIVRYIYGRPFYLKNGYYDIIDIERYEEDSGLNDKTHIEKRFRVRKNRYDRYEIVEFKSSIRYSDNTYDVFFDSFMQKDPGNKYLFKRIRKIK